MEIMRKSLHAAKPNGVMLRRDGVRTKRLLCKRMEANLIGALAAGLCVGWFACFVRSASEPRADVGFFVQITLLAVASYVGVASCASRHLTGGLQAILTNWLLTSIVGSLLVSMIVIVPQVAMELWGEQRMEGGCMDHLLVRVEEARSVWLVFSIIALVATGFFNFGDLLIKRGLRWLTGSDEGLSIISKK
jgi:hypothetical protein